MSYLNREGFRDILRDIVLLAWKSSLRRAPSASGLSARAVAVIAAVMPSVPLKKVDLTTTDLFLLPPRHKLAGESETRFVL